MKKPYLTYKPVDGYIHDWLVLGPCETPVDEKPRAEESDLDFRRRILQGIDHVTPEYKRPPLELDRFSCGEQTLFWEVEHCQDDHLLEKECYARVYSYCRVWAFARLTCKGASAITLHLSTTCPVAVWLNGKHVFYSEHVTDRNDQQLQRSTFTVSLKPGKNDLLIRLDQVAVGPVSLAMAVRLDDVPLESVTIDVPTIADDPKRLMIWQDAFKCAYLNRAVYTRDDNVVLICQDDMPSWRESVVRLQKPDGSIYGESFTTLKAKTKVESLYGVQLPSGQMQAMLMPHPTMFYERKFRARRTIPFWVSNSPYAFEPYNSYDDRLVEFMQVAYRSEDQLYSEIAKMALGWWDLVDTKTIQKVIERVKRQEANVLPDLVGLLGLRRRMARYEKFPSDLLPALDECILSFDYTPRETRNFDLSLECNQILLYTAQILAGQIHANSVFTASGLTGRQERTRGEKLAIAWLKQHGQMGFSLWHTYTDLVIVALAHLADLAASRTVHELAAVLLDKLLFELALGSLQGIYGVSRGHVNTSWLRSGRFAPESSLSRLMWGLGSIEGGVKGPVSLGLAGKNYQMPEIIRSIALDAAPEVWSRECHRLTEDEYVTIATYKTPDYILSSAQDYRAGQRGRREHIWQATMGTEALVFTNHPLSFIQSDMLPAAWWAGNDSLPRVAQWKDALIAIYNLPDNAWLDFTHAYFPCYAFDEHMIENGWAFARKGNAYLALYAAQGMQLIERGDDAFRELRSPGRQNVWLCQMGRAEVDGDFAAFRAKVLAQPPKVQGLEVEWQTARAERLTFGWNAPLMINGEEQPITISRHIESPYAIAEMPAETMDIVYGQDVMRLHFT